MLGECCRNIACERHKELYTTTGTHKDAFDKTILRPQVFVHKAEGNLWHTSLRIKSHHRGYFVDSGASLQMMGRSSLTADEQKTVRPTTEGVLHPISDCTDRGQQRDEGVRQRVEHGRCRDTGRGHASTNIPGKAMPRHRLVQYSDSTKKPTIDKKRSLDLVLLAKLCTTCFRNKNGTLDVDECHDAEGDPCKSGYSLLSKDLLVLQRQLWQRFLLPLV